MAYKHIEIPEDGEQITITDSGDLNVPSNPIIPFIVSFKNKIIIKIFHIFFLNTFLGGLVSYPTIINKLPTLGLLSLNWRDILRIIISISIGMKAIPSKGDGLSIWSYISESDMNFLLKLFAQITITPLVLLIYLLNCFIF